MAALKFFSRSDSFCLKVTFPTGRTKKLNLDQSNTYGPCLPGVCAFESDVVMKEFSDLSYEEVTNSGLWLRHSSWFAPPIANGWCGLLPAAGPDSVLLNNIRMVKGQFIDLIPGDIIQITYQNMERPLTFIYCLNETGNMCDCEMDLCAGSKSLPNQVRDTSLSPSMENTVATAGTSLQLAHSKENEMVTEGRILVGRETLVTSSIQREEASKSLFLKPERMKTPLEPSKREGGLSLSQFLKKQQEMKMAKLESEKTLLENVNKQQNDEIRNLKLQLSQFRGEESTPSSKMDLQGVDCETEVTKLQVDKRNLSHKVESLNRKIHDYQEKIVTLLRDLKTLEAENRHLAEVLNGKDTAHIENELSNADRHKKTDKEKLKWEEFQETLKWEESQEKMSVSKGEGTAKSSLAECLEKEAKVLQSWSESKDWKSRSYQEFEGELDCTICHCLLNRPTTLNCGHTFCTACINRWRDTKNECPTCRVEIMHQVRVLLVDQMVEKIAE